MAEKAQKTAAQDAEKRTATKPTSSGKTSKTRPRRSPATEKPPTKKPPSGLGDAGKRIWNDVHGDLPAGWSFTAVELENLEAAAIHSDRRDELEAVIRKDGLMVAGSTGQKVLHPAVAEVRLLTQTISKHLGLIEIPNEETGRTETAASIRGRNAANARWAKRDAWKTKSAEVKRRRRGEA